jgi:tetratricopeptide (TPR) repeat protein
MSETAREIFVRQLGPRHLYVARALENQASAESEMEDPAALGHLESARSILAAVLPADDLILIQLDTNIAVLWQEQGRFAEVVEVSRRSMQILEGKVARDRGDFINALSLLAAALDAQGKHDEATPYLERAAAMASGKGDPAAAEVLANAGQAFLSRGRLADARAVLTRAIAINDKNLPPDDIGNARALVTLAECDLATGNRAETRRLLDRALALGSGLSPMTAAARGQALFAYAHLLGRGPEAVAMAKRAREAYGLWKNFLATERIGEIDRWLASHRG